MIYKLMWVAAIFYVLMMLATLADGKERPEPFIIGRHGVESTKRFILRIIFWPYFAIMAVIYHIKYS